jgi:hypothetical protein
LPGLAEGAAPRCSDPLRPEDLCNLADATAGVPGFFVRGGGLYWMHEGTVIAVSGEVLAQTIERHVVTQRAVGTPGQSDWKFVYEPYKPSGKEVRALLTATTWKTGSLIARVGEA